MFQRNKGADAPFLMCLCVQLYSADQFGSRPGVHGVKVVSSFASNASISTRIAFNSASAGVKAAAARLYALAWVSVMVENEPQ